jgi:hypothetical protein
LRISMGLLRCIFGSSFTCTYEVACVGTLGIVDE